MKVISEIILIKWSHVRCLVWAEGDVGKIEGTDRQGNRRDLVVGCGMLQPK